jgi:hypothetical protein
VAVDTSGSGWSERAEAALRELRDVDGVSIQADGDRVSEIHIETRSRRPAKQIVRDVQTILRTRFNRQIDHRVVSVAYTEAPDAGEEAARPRLEAQGVREEDAAPAVPATPVPAAAPIQAAVPFEAPLRAAEAPRSAPAPAEDRVRFESVNLYVTGPRVQAIVELRWKGLTRTGSASGLASRDAADPLIAAATISALQEFLEDEIGLGQPEVSDLRIGRQAVKIAAVPLVAHRMEKTLVGSCTVEQDAQQAVVLATLAALNRIIGGLRTREPIDYVLRPASPQEASGAKRQ